ncbi:MFS transporter [Streptomyces sp. V2]|uniref:MFS transporter n=1 Tax=Streptomyces TaxID=1883 RepID=UPI0006EB584B|nr:MULTISPECIES: MFS transporter [Streptomyces]PWG13432.1 MFS transporter [Streptomyces sp. V2]
MTASSPTGGKGQRLLFAAVVIDSTGSGLAVPFLLLYLTRHDGMPATTAGTVLTVAGIVALAAGPLSGPLVDRFGPQRVVQVAHLLRAAAFLGYLTTASPRAALALAVLAAVGDNLFWPANRAFLARRCAPDELLRWYGLERTLRNVGLAAGGLAAGFLAGLGSAGLRSVMAANAASYLLATALIALLPAAGRGPRRVSRAAPDAPRPGRPYVTMVAANTLLVLVTSALPVLVPLYVVQELGRPSWLVGVVFALNTLLVTVGQVLVVRWVERRDHLRVMQGAGAVWAVSAVLFGAASGLPGAFVAPLLVVAVVVFTAAELMHGPTGDAVAVRMAPEDRPGRHLGLHQLSWGVGSALAPLVLTGALSLGAGWPWALLAVAALVACGALSTVRSAVGRVRAGPAEREERQKEASDGR